jgi:hypothetical protein
LGLSRCWRGASQPEIAATIDHPTVPSAYERRLRR